MATARQWKPFPYAVVVDDKFLRYARLFMNITIERAFKRDPVKLFALFTVNRPATVRLLWAACETDATAAAGVPAATAPGRASNATMLRAIEAVKGGFRTNGMAGQQFGYGDKVSKLLGVIADNTDPARLAAAIVEGMVAR